MPKKKTTKPPRIDAEALIHALEQHVLANAEMTPSQVSAALALLKKIMPDDGAKKIIAEAEALHAQEMDHEDALRELE